MKSAFHYAPCGPSRHRIFSLFLALALLLTAPAAWAATVYVNASVSGGTGDGSSWTNAFATLQPAIDAAQAGDEVWVAQGIYKPTTTTDQTIPFVMKEGVKIYGGFTIGQMNLSDRNIDPATNNTVLSGDIDNDNDKAGNSIHVIYSAGMTAAAVLDGFTVSGGNAINSSGGGMYNSGSSPTLTNCSFRNNFASQAGGGMYNNASNPTLTNCSFQSNSNLYGGAGLANNNSSPTLTNCSFQSNSSLDFNGLGGGMSNTSSNPTLTNCTFKGNYAYGGGGMSNDGSSPTLTNCSFQENYTENSGGGGMYNKDYSNPVLTNCTFRGNIANNYYGGAMLNVSSSPSMTNCILFDNGGNNTITFFFYSRFTVSNCLYEPSVTGIIPLEGNIVTSVNPFVSGTSIMLRPCSLAIDAGNDAANTTVTDLAGNPRKVRVIDMGAYEFQGNLPLAAEISANPTNNLGFRVTINGGTGPYKVVYSDGTNNYTIDGYQSGDNIPVPADQSITYTLGAVTDINGCKASTSGSATVQEERCGPGNKNFKICYYGIEQCVSEKIAKRYLKLGATMGSCGGSSSARLGVEENTKLPLQLSLKAFPNPVQDLMTLEVLAPKAGPATFEVLDLTGRVRQTHHENLTEGLNEVIFRLGSLNAGIYLIRIVDAVKSQAVVRVSKQ